MLAPICQPKHRGLLLPPPVFIKGIVGVTAVTSIPNAVMQLDIEGIGSTTGTRGDVLASPESRWGYFMPNVLGWGSRAVTAGVAITPLKAGQTSYEEGDEITLQVFGEVDAYVRDNVTPVRGQGLTILGGGVSGVMTGKGGNFNKTVGILLEDWTGAPSTNTLVRVFFMGVTGFNRQ